MKIKLITAYNYYISLLELQRMGLKLPIKLSWTIDRNLDRLRKDAELFEAKKQELIENAAMRDEEGKVITKVQTQNGMKHITYPIAEDKREQFVKDLETLSASEVEIEIMTVGIDVLSQIDEDKRFDPLPAGKISELRFMIEE